jgi:hypothetical protein
MKNSLFSLLLLVTLVGCQSSSPVKEWRKPGFYGAPRQSLAVMVATYRPAMRVQYENALCAELRARGVLAKPTYGSIPLEVAFGNREAAVQRISGVDGVLVVRPADPLSMNAFTVSPSNSGTTLKPWQNWFDFFTADKALSAPPTAAGAKSQIGIHAALFEYPTGQLLWSATAVTQLDGSASESQQIARGIVRRLQAAALIR